MLPIPALKWIVFESLSPRVEIMAASRRRPSESREEIGGSEHNKVDLPVEHAARRYRSLS